MTLHQREHEQSIGSSMSATSAPMPPMYRHATKAMGGVITCQTASTGMANQVQLHFMGMQGDVMKMNEVAAIDLPSGKTVELKPGSYHLMILGVKAPIKPGDNLKMKLKFQKAGELAMVFPASTPESAAHSHEH